EDARAVATGGLARDALDALARTWGVVESLGLSDVFEIDFGDVSGLDYYTGLVFKLYVDGAGARVGGGGRYDDLTASFGRREPATGFVLDLDAITEVIMRGGDFEMKNGPRETISVAEGESMAERFREATGRRARGERIRME
ncbi:MAG: ATP phosphoribosyltransferase regulatory subunit, partial [Rubrivivax sp.]|nr:ATP phosphoribosyltransferase regulatory subunit [Pyrinomonadaceae bacterium]